MENPKDSDKPEGPRDDIEDEHGNPLCGARRKGGFCHARPTKGFKRCRIHGGHPKSGAPIKHGRYSKSLGKYAQAYEDALNDDSLLDLEEPIALLDAIAQRFTERLVELDTPAFRKDALRLFKAAVAKVAEPPAELARLGELLETGGKEDAALRDLADQAEKVSKAVSKAWDVRLARKNVLNAKDLHAVLGRMVDVVRDVCGVNDASKVAMQFDRLQRSEASHN